MIRISGFNYYDGGQIVPAGQSAGTLSITLMPEGAYGSAGNMLLLTFKGLRPEAAIEKAKKLVDVLEGEGQ